MCSFCLHAYVLFDYAFLYLSFAHVCLPLSSVSGKKMQDFSCIDALHLRHSSSCPSSLLSPSVLLCSQSEYTFSFSLSQFERTISCGFPLSQTLLMGFLLSVLNFFLLVRSFCIQFMPWPRLWPRCECSQTCMCLSIISSQHWSRTLLISFFVSVNARWSFIT